MMKQVVIKDDRVIIWDWIDGKRGTGRQWGKSQWQGSLGDVFRRTHVEKSRRQGGRIRWFVEV